MANKTPVRVKYNGSDPSGLAEFQNGEFIDPQFLPDQTWTYTSDTAPVGATLGETWYQPSTNYFYINKDTGWERITLDDQLSDGNTTNRIDAGHF